jgi:hypothetical protein
MPRQEMEKWTDQLLLYLFCNCFHIDISKLACLLTKICQLFSVARLVDSHGDYQKLLGLVMGRFHILRQPVGARLNQKKSCKVLEPHPVNIRYESLILQQLYSPALCDIPWL